MAETRMTEINQKYLVPENISYKN